jgi:hypothetical protein
MPTAILKKSISTGKNECLKSTERWHLSPDPPATAICGSPWRVNLGLNQADPESVLADLIVNRILDAKE